MDDCREILMPSHKFTKITDIKLFDEKVDPEKFDVDKIKNHITRDLGPGVPITNLYEFKKIVMGKSKIKDKSKKVFGKWSKAHYVVGVDGGKLVATGKTLDGSYEYTLEIVDDFSKRLAAKPTVIDLDHEDDTIRRSSEKMAKAKGVDVTLPDEKDLTNVTGDIIILAHGGSSNSSPGKIYCKNFADKSAKDIIKFLVKEKPLPKDYAGTVYLDGCFTAAGSSKGRVFGDLQNFCGTVYKGLTTLGYKKLKVKGNLGTAKTQQDGTEMVMDAQAEKKLEVVLKDSSHEVTKIHKKYLEVRDKHLKAEAAYFDLESDIKIKSRTLPRMKEDEKVAMEKTIEALQTKYDKLAGALPALKAERNKFYQARDKLLRKHGIVEQEVQDLVGTFGPETL